MTLKKTMIFDSVNENKLIGVGIHHLMKEELFCSQ